MADVNDSAGTIRPRPIPLINPALELGQVLELLASHSTSLHRLTRLMCYQGDDPDVDVSLADVGSAIEPMAQTIAALADAAVLKAYSLPHATGGMK